MESQIGYHCFDCHKKLTAEERLLAAIFGEADARCYDCQNISTQPQCYVCGQPANLTLNGVPSCPTHMGVTT